MPQLPQRPDEVRVADVAGRAAVLVVDDNRANLVAMEALLASLDLDVQVAASGEEALKQLLQRDFAVVLMDVQMPGLDGFATTELIRKRDRTRHTPIIFVTAIFTDDASARKAYSLGALDFVTKPFDEQILRAKVAALVGHYRQAAIIEQQAEALRAKQREADRAHAAQAAAEAANRAKDEFLAMLSHELRAPLNAILGWASLLETQPGMPPKASRAAQTIARSARAQSKLIDELLDVSQIVADKLTLESRVIDVEAIVRAAAATFGLAAAEKNVEVAVRVEGGGFAVMGDARRFEQLVGHLLSNAVKFSRAGGEVDVALTRTGDEVRLVVRDDGIGISAEFLPHVFERFRQKDGTMTRRHGGLGIGLTVARHLAELHGGSVEAFSDGPGAGAEFVLRLPAVAAPGVAAEAQAAPGVAAEAQAAAGGAANDDAPARVAARAPAAAAAAQPLQGVRLLFVDDDPDARDLTSAILEDAGGRVVTAGSAADALGEFAKAEFDVVISDLGMPDVDGLTLIRKLRALDGGRKVLALAVSGHGTTEDLAASRRAGFDAHVVKPCESPALVALVARLVRAGGSG